MAQYEFLTSWCVDAPIERVFAVLNDSAAFPEWWKGVTAVEVLEPGEADGARLGRSLGRAARQPWARRRARPEATTRTSLPDLDGWPPPTRC